MLVPLGLQINSWGKGATPMSDTSPTFFTTKQGGDAFRKIHTSKPSDPSQKKKPMQVWLVQYNMPWIKTRREPRHQTQPARSLWMWLQSKLEYLKVK